MSTLDRLLKQYNWGHHINGTWFYRMDDPKLEDAAAELAELRAELQAANEDAEQLYRALKSTDMEFMELEGPALAAHEARME